MSKPLKRPDYIIDPITGCWNWNGVLNCNGYGVKRYKGDKWLAHRLYYTRFKGQIPPGYLVCHKCDNPKCCNPSHLFVGTTRTNMIDMAQKGRSKTPWGKNHPDSIPIDLDKLRGMVMMKMSHEAIAQHFGVSEGHMTRIINGKTWHDFKLFPDKEEK